MTSATPIPLTAGSESRVSAEVRRIAWEMAEQHTSLEPVEALCRTDRGGPDFDGRPGVVLLDRRFPIWLAIFDDEAFISIDTELLEGAARSRFEAASGYVKFLADRGYSRLFDHQTETFSDARTEGGAFVHRVARAASSRRFDQIRTDHRIGFVAGFFGFAVADFAVNAVRSSGMPLSATLAKAVVLGFAITAIQQYQARKALATRLDQLRQQILTDSVLGEHLTFSKSRKTVRGEIFSAVIFGTFAATAYVVSLWVVFALFVVAFACAIAALLLDRRIRVALNGQAIEGLTRVGRVRMPFVDVDRITEFPFPDLTAISSCSYPTICVPASLEHYDELLDVLWERVARRSTQPDGSESLLQNRSDRPFDASLQQARRTVSFRLHAVAAARPPLWMLLFHRKHPLKSQYSWHRHLMERGQVTLGLIIYVQPTVIELPRGDHIFDGSAVALFAPAVPFEQAGELLNEIATRVWGSSEDQEEQILEAVESFKGRLGEHWPFPSWAEVPESITRGNRVCCSGLMVVRRHLPLGHLRSYWVPLLVDPSACPYVMVLPMRYWDASWRRRWKAASARADQPSRRPNGANGR